MESKKVLLLGSGFVARPCAEYVVRKPSNELTIGEFHRLLPWYIVPSLTPSVLACRTLESAKKLALGLPNTRAISLDVSSPSDLDAQVAAHDLVISLVPYLYHAAVIKSAIKNKKHVVTTSYVSPAMQELESEVKKAGIVVMNEIGLDPGIDHLYAVKTIDEVHEKGGKASDLLGHRKSSISLKLNTVPRSKSSCLIAVLFQHQNARTILLATNAPGHLEDFS